MSNRLSRRGFIALLTGFVATAGVSCSRLLNGLLQGDVTAAPTQTLPSLRVTSEPDPIEEYTEGVTEQSEATLPPKEKADFGPRVIHFHSSDATYWNFGTDYYGNFIDQDAVNDMVDRGIVALTGAGSVASAWQALIPRYLPGETPIAMKANFNNSFYCNPCEVSCEEWQLKIDALIQPVNAIIRGLLQAFPALDLSDIWVFDATIGRNPPESHRRIPERFIDGCLYSGVRYFDQGCQEPATFNSSRTDAYVVWNNPSDIAVPPQQKITDVLIEAAYVINMPILKLHGGAGVSLGFKNHFGTIDNCRPLHDWTCFNWPASAYTNRYNPLIDIYRNPYILDKTILTIGDGLFGDRASNTNIPARWATFGNDAPNSLFFSTDPVAIDSVMCDFLHMEGYQGGLLQGSDDYLRLAADYGLGVYERGDPWKSGYRNIDFVDLSL